MRNSAFVAALALLVPAPLFAGQRPSATDAVQLQGYDLSAPNLERLVALDQLLAEQAKRDPRLPARLAAVLEQSRGIDDQVARVYSTPELAQGLATVGLAARDYVLTRRVAQAAAQASERRRQNPDAPQEPGLQGANLEFVDSHPDVVRRWQETESALLHAARPAAPRPDGNSSERLRVMGY